MITRRDFLTSSFAMAGAGFCLPFYQCTRENIITKVHVVFKTHLDVGFTDLADKVVESYFTNFIPQAMNLSKNLREKYSECRFRWTTGSWLIYKYLEDTHGPDRKLMEEGIMAGDICWHALPFTMHSEALDTSLFDLGIKLSERLDQRFGKMTIGAKMTDVPGHTRSIVPSLEAAGIKFLHIGVNPASSPPKVPQFFKWQAPDGSMVVVMYDNEYGGQVLIPGSSEAVAIILTGDNHGPHDENAVIEIYRNLAKRFPQAEIVSNDLSDIASTCIEYVDQLPTIKSELGDSWIHGIGSDPFKIGQLREMSRLRKSWIQSSTLQDGSELDLKIGVPLIRVAEHTWGLDVKSHLKAWDIYTPEALVKARKQEAFKRIEASWQEKRNYIQDAINALPSGMKSQTLQALRDLKPVRPELENWKKLDQPRDPIKLPQFLLGLDSTGALCMLENRMSGREWAARDQLLGCFAYQSFSQADYTRFMNQYLTQRPEWALADFGKPGLENVKALSQTRQAQMTAAWFKQEKKSDLILVEMEVVDMEGNAIPGCPKSLTLKYSVSKTEPQIDITLQWFDKMANRLPEAMWFSLVPPVFEGGKWMMDKMGQDVDPRNVVEDGGHKLHAVAEGVSYTDQVSKMMIKTLDAPLVAPGERTMLDFDNTKPAASDGMHFCLYNNVWGTNFVMWFDDDMRFRFKIHCS